ncbi:MAG: hypothetical protein AAGH70_00815 [Pseudomonadota bacterium]
MIDIRPDPQRPRGGFAQLSVDGITDTEAAKEVAVYDSYQQKWLGPGGWQPGRAALPARRVELEGETLKVIIGPDIVNNIEESTPVKIEIAGYSWETYWPDDVNHGPDIALEGDLGSTGDRPEPEAPRTMKTLKPEPLPEPTETLQQEVDLPPDEGPIAETIKDVEEDGDKKRSLLIPIVAGVVLMAAMAGGAWYFLNAQEEEPIVATAPETVVEPAAVPPAGPACGASDLAALEGGFTAVLNGMRGCIGTLSADAALGLVEQASAQEDGTALVLFGALYDGEVTEDGLETEMGLTFGDDPARAASYYARAVAAGSADGQARLESVCDRLVVATDTLSQSAHQDYCQ